MNISETPTEFDLKEARKSLVLYADEIEHFETHDLSEELANGPEVHFEVSPQARRQWYALEVELAAKLKDIANQRGIPAETLLDEWVREKLTEAEVTEAALQEAVY